MICRVGAAPQVSALCRLAAGAPTLSKKALRMVPSCLSLGSLSLTKAVTYLYFGAALESANDSFRRLSFARIVASDGCAAPGSRPGGCLAARKRDALSSPRADRIVRAEYGSLRSLQHRRAATGGGEIPCPVRGRKPNKWMCP